MIHKTFPIAEKLLDSGLHLSQSLHRHLQEEMEAFKQHRTSASLESMTLRKQQLVNELNQFAKQLGQVLETERLPNNQLGINAYLDKATNAGLDVSELVKTWKQITDLAVTSRALNDRNGASIDILLRHTRQSLNILKGKSPTATTYGPDGSTKSDLLSGTSISV